MLAPSLENSRAANHIVGAVSVGRALEQRGGEQGGGGEAGSGVSLITKLHCRTVPGQSRFHCSTGQSRFHCSTGNRCIPSLEDQPGSWPRPLQSP